MLETYSEELTGMVSFIFENQYEQEPTDAQVERGCKAYLACLDEVFEDEIDAARERNDLDRLDYLATCRPFVDVTDEDSEIAEIIGKAESAFTEKVLNQEIF